MVRLSALILLASAVTFAQTPAAKNVPAPAKEALTYTIPAPNLDCPIGFTASRQAGLQIMTASDAKQLGPGQGLHLMLNPHSGPAIQSIEVTVYASSLKPRPLLLDASSDDTISKTFTLERQVGSASLTEADVWMRQTGSVRWADLISITYADGTTWHPVKKDLKCQAVPSSFLLIGAK